MATTVSEDRASGKEGLLEPWYHIAKAVLLPPFKLWFNWHFEGLDLIPNEGPIIVVGNHLSYVDPFAHGYFVVRAGRRPRFLGKQELFENWFTRMVLLGAKQIPVRRGSGETRPLEDAIRALEAGEVVFIYPEGTSVTDHPDFLPGRGKTGAARLALETGAPILPVGTWGGQYVWLRSGRQSLKFGRPIWLKAGESIEVSAHREGADETDLVHELTDRLMGELGALVDDLRTRYPKRWIGR